MYIFGNTTSSRQDQLTSIPYGTLVRHLATRKLGAIPAAYLLYPAPLVLIIVHISRLRCLVPRDTSGSEPDPPTPDALLQGILDFSPTEWADTIGSGSPVLVPLGLIFQSSVALYCILSLQSSSHFDSSPEMEGQKKMHYERLLSLLRTSINSPQIGKLIFWPFSVAGVAAARGRTEDRAFICEQLVNLGQTLGLATPVVLKGVLLKFWRSGSTRWDDCFEEPHYFAE